MIQIIDLRIEKNGFLLIKEYANRVKEIEDIKRIKRGFRGFIVFRL